MRVEAALTWNDPYHEKHAVLTTTSVSATAATHLAGFRAALTRVVTKYADEHGLGKKRPRAADRR